MADPRKACPTLIDKSNRLQAKKKGFFDAVRTLGNLEVLNENGATGDIRTGLETIARVSDSVRSGKSVIPGREGDEIYNGVLSEFANTALGSFEEGANIVLDTVGIGRNKLDLVNSIDSGVANRAYAEAEGIWDRAKQGNFKIEDIPSVFQSLQNLETVARKIFVPSASETAEASGLSKAKCLPSPFAMDLIQRAPKNKFSYIVDIKFSPAYASWNSDFASGLAFVTKRTGRPEVDFHYEEVNMYNFWTHVIKRAQYMPISMSFYEDNTGSATNFYAAYMRALSPIANKNFAAGSGSSSVSGAYEYDTMNFKNAKTPAFNKDLPTYSSGTGALIDNGNKDNPTKVLLERITLYHIGQYGNTVTAYHMFNPKITTLMPDELSMQDSGEGSEFTFEFNYDSLFVEPNQKVQDFGTQKLYELSSDNNKATYPLDTAAAPAGAAGGNTSLGSTILTAGEQVQAAFASITSGGSNRLGNG